ncbi:MAG: phosphohydrolase, partial [Actinobacteria bacterium]
MIAREDALALVRERVGNRNLVNHCLATEYIMRALAERAGLDDVPDHLTGLGDRG